MYARLAQKSLQNLVVVVLAVKLVPQCSHTFLIDNFRISYVNFSRFSLFSFAPRRTTSHIFTT